MDDIKNEENNLINKNNYQKSSTIHIEVKNYEYSLPEYATNSNNYDINTKNNKNNKKLYLFY